MHLWQVFACAVEPEISKQVTHEVSGVAKGLKQESCPRPIPQVAKIFEK